MEGVTGPSSALNDGRPWAPAVSASTVAAVPTPHRLPGRPLLYRLGGQVRGRVVPGSVTAAVVGVAAATVAYLAGFAHGVGDVWTVETVSVGLVAAGVGGAATQRTVARIGLSGSGRLLAVIVVSLVPVLLGASLLDLVLLVGAAGTTAGLAHWATSSRIYTGGETAVFIGLPAAFAAGAGVAGLSVPALAAISVLIGGLLFRRTWDRILATIAGVVVPAGLTVAAVGSRWGQEPTHLWPVLVIVGAVALAVLTVRWRHRGGHR